MPYSHFNLNKRKYKPELYLATPQKRIITKLYDANHITNVVKFGKINELNFRIPYDIETLNDEYTYDIEQGISLTRNDVIDKIKDRFLIKYKLGNYEEWYMIRQKEDDADENKDTLSVQCFSLAYELRNVKIIQYNVVSYNILEILKGKPFDETKGILAESLWAVGHVDESVLERYRAFDVTAKNGLDILFELIETFDCVPIFDTENRMINLYDINNIGTNRGLKVDYGKYLKSLRKQSISDEVVTRLKIYGRDGLTIRNINPLGTDYIEDYSYFLFPYGSLDNEGNPINYSGYMSTELCEAIIAHQELIKERTPQFTSYIGKLELLNQLLIAKTVELRNISNQLKLIRDNLAIAQRAKSGGTTIQFFQEKIKNKELEIEKQNANIKLLQDEIKSINESINELKSELSEENNFTSELLAEKRLFTLEDDFIDTNIVEEHELYKSGIEHFQEVNKPKTSISIDIVNFLDVLEEQDNWDKLILGDLIKVKYKKFNTEVEVRIVEISYDFESNSINLIITNVKDYTFTDEYDLIGKLIHRNVNIAKAINVSKVRWDGIDQARKTLDDILSNPWETLRLEDEIDWGEVIDIGRIYDEIEQITMPEIELPDFQSMIDSALANIQFPELPEIEFPDYEEIFEGLEYYEYGLADWNPDGVLFYYVQHYTEEPVIKANIQSHDVGIQLDTYDFMMVCEHITEGEGEEMVYIGAKIYPHGNVPAEFDGKISISAVCDGLVVEEEEEE